MGKVGLTEWSECDEYEIADRSLVLERDDDGELREEK